MIRTRLFLLLLCPIFLSAQVQSPRIFDQADRVQMEQWVEQQMASLDLNGQIGQLIMPIVYPSTREADIVATQSLVSQGAIGGILYQKGTIAMQYEMNRRLQQAARIPLLITLDGEYGLWMRLKDAPRYPRNMAIGHIADKRYIYQYGREVAEQCRLMGIHVNFAPDMDVNNNPKNLVIGTRSFGTRPLDVAVAGLAYSFGLEDGGVLSVAKHFPGHGNTDIDSHKALPTISGTKAELERTELYPFKKYIMSGMGGMMIGHLRIPALEPDGTPASMSRAIVSDLLKQQMGFEGLIFTDAMEMQGMQTKGTLPISVRALRAGVDILLGPTNVATTLNEIRVAVEAGTLDRQEIADKCRKVLQYKYRLILSNPMQYRPASEISNLINSTKAETFRQELWYRSIYLKRGAQHLPIKNKSVAVVHLGIQSANDLSRRMSTLGIKTQVYSSKASNTDKVRILKSLSGAKTIIVAIYGRPIAEFDNLIAQISKNANVVICLFGSPFGSSHLPQADRSASIWLDAFENCSDAYEAVMRKLMTVNRQTYILPNATEAERSLMTSPLFKVNEKRTQGLTEMGTDDSNQRSRPSTIQTQRAQVTIPALASENLRRSIDDIAHEGLTQGAYPGCRVMVMHRNKILIDASYGSLTYTNSHDKVNSATVYDLASITKAAATTPAVMLLVADGKLRLQDRLSKILPRFRNTKLSDITIEDLLLHRSGLVPTINFYTDLINKESYTDPLISYKQRNGYVQISRNAWGNPFFSFIPSLASEHRTTAYPYQMAQGLYLSDSVRTLMADRIAAQIPRTNKAYRYSDVNFVLLQFVIEAITHEPMDTFLTRRIYKSISTSLCYNPLERYIPLKNIAPTQDDRFLRKQIVRGTVDDETAACLGGVGGNAGLFGTATDLMKLLQLYQTEGIHNGHELIPQRIFRLFLNTTDKHNYRSLGFDKARDGNSTAAESASSLTYGHNGFTGTCFWVDPESDIIFVFLSNRTFPSRTNTKLITMKIRQRMHQAVYQALGLVA